MGSKSDEPPVTTSTPMACRFTPLFGDLPRGVSAEKSESSFGSPIRKPGWRLLQNAIDSDEDDDSSAVFREQNLPKRQSADLSDMSAGGAAENGAGQTSGASAVIEDSFAHMSVAASGDDGSGSPLPPFDRRADRSRSQLVRPSRRVVDSDDSLDDLPLEERVKSAAARAQLRRLEESSARPSHKEGGDGSVDEDQVAEASAPAVEQSKSTSSVYVDECGGESDWSAETVDIDATRDNSVVDVSDGLAADDSALRSASACASVAEAYESLVEEAPAETPQPGSSRRYEELRRKLSELMNWRAQADLSKLPDGGRKLINRIEQVQEEMLAIRDGAAVDRVAPPVIKSSSDSSSSSGRSTTQAQGGASKGPPLVDARPTLSLEHNKQAMERFLSTNPQQQRLYGGKMTDARLKEARTVTLGHVEDLHRGQQTRPADQDETDDPAHLTIALKTHQRQAISFMLWREHQVPPGGILADDMGLGKTLTVVALILKTKQLRREQGASDAMRAFERQRAKLGDRENLVPSTATLVACPASVINQWNSEIEQRVKTGRLKVAIFHGPKRAMSAESLARYDVVLTTYGTVNSEVSRCVDSDEDEDDGENKQNKGRTASGGKSVLLRIAWERIVLDEAHQIKNHLAKMSKACCRVPAVARWCLSGTPVHNNLLDFYSLLKFLRLAPFGELAVFKEYIMSKDSQAQKRLNTIVKSILLRRTKEQTCAKTGLALVPLKPKVFETHVVDLDECEAAVYQRMFLSCQRQVREFVKSEECRDRELVAVSSGRAKAQDFGYRNPFLGGARGSAKKNDRFANMNCILVMLMRLRQACAHMALTKEGIDIEALQDDADGQADEKLAEEFAAVSLDEESLEQSQLTNKERVAQLFERQTPSTKLRHLVERIKDLRTSCPGDKCVVVSQWAKLLDIVTLHLARDAPALRLTRISGDVPPKVRQERVDAFNKPSTGTPSVMLLSLAAGGVGLNLVGGNHLFLLDLHWNPALERQACDRIYRMGQTKGVFVHKFVCKSTIEERVLEIQEKKLLLAREVLEGATGKSKANKLTLGDLKFLFRLNEPQQQPVHINKP